MDQRPVEKRQDVLVYTTPPLKSELAVVGPIRVLLYASTSARDTDFTAKLVDVLPDGEARNLTDGILRLRYRDSLETPQLAKSGEVYKLTIEAGSTANLAEDTRLLKASQTVYHDRLRPSCVPLPVVP